jgi:nucleotide-binding universal stress UspA family protein
MTSNTIVVPLDGTALSNASLPLARTLAIATGASIKLVRVTPHEDAGASSQLRRIASELAASGINVESSVRRGHAADEILAELRAQPAAMVVMRTHGRVGVERAILGSVTEHVLARSRIPVVVMRPGERRVTHIHKVLVPLDGSSGDAVALCAALRLASTSGASIKLIQLVVPVALQTVVAYQFDAIGYADPDLDDEALASARSYVSDTVARLRDSGVSAEGGALMAPAVAPAIVNAAQTEQADLVAMSTRALTGPARTVLGSVADEVVRTAHCPVLLVNRMNA